MLPDKMEHCIVFMNSWDVSGVFWSFSKCNIKIPHLPADPSITGACRKRNALKWSIIDLAREHSNARISRQQGGHCRWQVAAGGDRMWPTCAMRWCWARFGGAHRESSPSIPPLQLPAWSRSRAVVKTLDAF